MPDAVYKSYPFIFSSKGIIARKVDDTASIEEYLSLTNLEELAENAFGTRLGSTLVNAQGTLGQPVYPLGSVSSPTLTPTTVAAQGPSSPAWSNPSNLIATGASLATVTVSSGATPSQQLLAAGISAALPIGAVILGFGVNFHAFDVVTGLGRSLKFNLTISGTPVGVARTQVIGEIEPAILTVGGAADLWGYAGWNASNVNANLGILVQATSTNGTPATISVNSLTVTIYYLAVGIVHSLAKLSGLNGNAWRYAGVGGTLWRITGTNPGPYSWIANTLSGNPWTAVAFRPNLASAPTMFFADANGMLKDNGSYANPQQMGIFQPQFPVSAQSQAPQEVTLDNYVTTESDYTYTGIGSGSNATYVNTTLSSNVTSTGIQAVTVADPTQPRLFQLLTIGSGGGAEVVQVLFVTATGFVANFTKTHSSGDTVASACLSVTVPASTTATVGISFASLPAGANPIPANWPNGQPLQQADYIGLFLYVSDPSQVQSIQLAFDCGDGSFQSDYFYKVIAQGPLQSLLDTASSNSTEATTAATDALLDESLGLYGAGAGSIVELNTGLDNWTPLLIQLSDFAGAGRADFSDPVFNWSAVNGYQITITMNDGSSATIQLAALTLFGGAGPDSFAGVGYDYLFTLYNDNDGTESNPCMSMTNVNPPNNTNWVVPRRQPVLLTMNLNTFGPLGQLQDGQITAIRIYRRGGTLGDNYRRVFELPVNISGGGTVTYTDTTSDSDLAASDIISFLNDVPVTSSLPNPVNTTLVNAINTTNQIATVTPVSMANISVRQQVTLGSPTALANNFETVIVLTVGVGSFTAFVQNTHAVGENVQATAAYGQPLTIMAEAFGQMWFAGDVNNPSYLYWSNPTNPQGAGSDQYIDVGSPDDPITAIAKFAGNLYVSTPKTGWQSVAPGSNQNGSPTIYPTKCKHGCVAPHGFFITEEAIYYEAIDGLRAFAGGDSSYLTQDLEFIWQGVGTTPIVEADPTKFSQVVAAYWNMMGFFSYIGLDGNRHRVIGHQVYKRWRNDDADAQSILLEVDTNTLVYGDSNGLVHVDRQNLGYDQANAGGVLAEGAIPINLQTSYQNQGLPANQKNYNNLQLDVYTAGQPLTVTLLFNDGQFSINLGTVTNTQRAKYNFQVNAGKGQQAYKIALQITGNLTAQVYVYQASIEALPLPMTRKSFDTYDLNMGGTDSKICRDIFFQYSAGAPITVNVYYDSSTTPGFTFTMPTAGGIRNPLRQRLPAVSFRTIRFVGTSTADFMFWQDSCAWMKFQAQGRGYEKALFVEN
jgi:hypothetical protein